ncbi:MAG TPA: hypothetical protein VMZ52_06105 [Bryobacteraceae bacterium]|nr:hypothetical protein [Bryobacteraceae bacterium]
MTRIEEPETHAAPKDEAEICIPKLFWAALLIFAVNLSIVIWFYFSPGFSVRMSGFHPEEAARLAMAKPSVFDRTVDEKPMRIRAAAKVRPVLYDLPVLNIPAKTVLAVYEPPMPRATTVSMPRATEIQMHRATTVEIRPRIVQ